ncbi:MAG: hypothetical protein P8Y02_02855 [Deinococcales bacterium]
MVASGPRHAVLDQTRLNTVCAYAQHFERTADVAAYVLDRGGDSARALWVVRCEGSVARRITLWAVVCDFLRDHADEWGLEVHDEACRSLRDVLREATNE